MRGIYFVPAMLCSVYKSPNEGNSKELQDIEHHTPCYNKFLPLSELQDRRPLDQSFETLDYHNYRKFESVSAALQSVWLL